MPDNRDHARPAPPNGPDADAAGVDPFPDWFTTTAWTAALDDKSSDSPVRPANYSPVIRDRTALWAAEIERRRQTDAAQNDDYSRTGAPKPPSD